MWNVKKELSSRNISYVTFPYNTRLVFVPLKYYNALKFMSLYNTSRLFFYSTYYNKLIQMQQKHFIYNIILVVRFRNTNSFLFHFQVSREFILMPDSTGINVFSQINIFTSIENMKLIFIIKIISLISFSTLKLCL